MSLHADLLNQAKSLSIREPRRPKQASLRRAVSTAYYALFHLLISEGAQFVVSGGSSTDLRDLASRAFDHGTMKQACRAFASNGLTPKLQICLAQGVSSEIQRIAEVFLDLQKARHSADYDLGFRLSRGQARDLISEVDDAFRLWKNVRKTETAKTFLLSLLLWKQWSRR